LISPSESRLGAGDGRERSAQASVGVVIPALDVAPWLDAMLESLRGQTHAAWRCCVVDDGSSDATLERARAAAAADDRIRVEVNPVPGVGARMARSHGRDVLGDEHPYLYFPDGDDLLDAELLERLVRALKARSSAVAAFGRVVRVDEDGRPLPGSTPRRVVATRRWLRALRPGEPTPFETIWAGAGAAEAVTLFRSAAFDAVGGWREAPPWQSHTGTDLLLRLSLVGDVVYEDTGVYFHRRRAGQGSADAAMLVENDRALRRRWHDRAGADPRVAAHVRRAEFLERHRLTPRLAFANAAALARSGRLLLAARNIAGGVRRYRWSSPPTGPEA
jgi:glycosyltransferase involved in cell wall biosynthesis